MIRALLFLALPLTARADIGSWQFREIRLEISHGKPYAGRVMHFTANQSPTAAAQVQPGKTGVFAKLTPLKPYGRYQPWGVILTSTCPTDVPVSRARILIEAPFTALPPDIAKVVLSQTYQKKSVWSRLWDVGVTLSSTSLTASGVATGSKVQVIASAGISLMGLLVHLIWNPPDPAQFYGDIMPASVNVTAGGGVDGIGVIADKANRRAKAVGPWPVAACI